MAKYTNKQIIERIEEAKLNLDKIPKGYLCVCGETFKEPMDRVGHSVTCQVFADHTAGLELLKKFPRDKYGGYVIAAPAILVAFIRDYLDKEQAG